MPHAINFRALHGANLVTLPPEIEGNEPFDLQRAEGRLLTISRPPQATAPSPFYQAELPWELA